MLTSFVVQAQGEGENACFFSIQYQIKCDRITVQFGANANWPFHRWAFGDGTDTITGQPPISHDYIDVNPDLSPVTAGHFTDQWCEQTVDFPAIFFGAGCGSVRKVSDLIAANKLPANTLSGKTVYLFGTLDVDVANTFSACTLKVMGGEKIVVSNGGKLTLSGGTIAEAHIISGECEYLWTGIEVKTGGQLITDEATIQNAYYAVRPVYQVKGLVPMLSLSATTFSRNFIGLYAANGAFSITAFDANQFLGTDGSAIFAVSSCNPPAAISGVPFTRRTYAGIYFDGTIGGELDLSAGTGASYFSDLQAGIVAVNGNATIAHCQFENIATISGNSAPHQATAITFVDNRGIHELTVDGLGKNSVYTVSNCERGVFATTSKGHTRAFIKNCRMEHVQNGVVLTETAAGNFIELEVEDNYIECSKYTGALAQQITSTGIEIHDPNPWRSVISIGGNTIEVDQPGAFGSSPNAAIYPTGIHVAALLPQVGVSKNAMLLDINHNDIELTAGYRGIRVQNVAKAMIADNTVHNVLSNLATANVGIEGEGGISNTARCNTLTSEAISTGIYQNTSVGFHLDANTAVDLHGGIVIGNDNGTDCILSSNTFDVTSAPLYLTVGLSYNDALTGPQYLKGNLWEGDFTIGAAYVAGDDATHTYCNSRYHVSPDANIAGSSSNSVFVTAVEPCGDWFTVLDTTETRNTCPYLSSEPSPRRNEADQHLAGGGTDSLAVGFKWSAEMGLYRKFTEYPQLIDGDPDIEDFLDAQTGQPLSETYELRNSFAELFEDATSEAALAAIREVMADIREDMESTPPGFSGSNWTAWSAYSDQLDSLYGLAIGAMEDYVDAIESGADALLTENAGIDCDGNVPCENEQWLHDLFLDTRITDLRALTTTELENLAEMAQICPGEGGPAIFLARAWYYTLTGETLRDTCSSPTPEDVFEERSDKVKVATPVAWSVQPNPADTELCLTVPALETGAVLYIYNAWGQIVQTIDVPAEGLQTIRMSTTGFANGLYTVYLQGNFNIPAVIKFVVIH